MEIETIVQRARAEGLSYGQYVLKHKLELAGKRPKPKSRLRADETGCKHCGRGFIATNSRHLFCCDHCRVAWNYKKRRACNE